jgi:hypothetical protein
LGEPPNEDEECSNQFEFTNAAAMARFFKHHECWEAFIMYWSIDIVFNVKMRIEVDCKAAKKCDWISLGFSSKI